MNAVQLHLALNHFPIIGVLLMIPLLAWGLARRSRDLLRATLGLTVLLAVMTYPVVLSGESAEELVEDREWASEAIIHEHEERGEKTLIMMLVTGAVAAFGLWRLRGDRAPDRLVPGITLGMLVVSSALLVWTSLEGGQIRHDEIRPGGTSMTEGSGPGGEDHGREDHDR